MRCKFNVKWKFSLEAFQIMLHSYQLLIPDVCDPSFMEDTVPDWWLLGTF